MQGPSLRGHLRIAVLSVLLLTLFTAGGAESRAQTGAAALPDAGAAQAWMHAILDAVQREAYSPPRAARVFAYSGVTLYEAAHHSDPTMLSLGRQLHNLQLLPQPRSGQPYEWRLVVNSAMGHLLPQLFDNPSDETLNAFRALHDSLQANYARDLTPDMRDRSIGYGQMIANAVLAWAAADNYRTRTSLSYMLPTGNPSYWLPIGDQHPLEPHWEILRPYVLPMNTACDMPLEVPFSTEPDSEFYRHAEIVRQAVDEISNEERVIAVFWGDDPGVSYTPAGHWVYIVSGIVDQYALSLPDAATAYALTGIALGDAFISTWESKYRYQLLRPVTYIHNYIDRDWQPLINTPPFPEYPSGHSVASGAVATVLEHLFGDIRFEDRTHVSRGLPPRVFDRFDEAATEAAMSRLYGGIHYLFAIENGVAQGECVGQHIIDRLVLRDPVVE